MEQIMLKILDFVLIETDEELKGAQSGAVNHGVFAGWRAAVTPEAVQM